MTHDQHGDALVGAVIDAIELGFADITAKPGSYDFIRYIANQSEVGAVIALIERDVARRLLSDGAVEAADTAGDTVPIGPDNALVDIHNGYGAVKAALAHIGISTEDAQ